jgi:exodeoxyribonuclease V alpha subunit
MAEPTSEQGEQTLEGTIERIVYQDAESQWTVARVQLDANARMVTFVGNLPGLPSGTALRAVGRWVEDRRYGQQFKVAAFTPLDPGTLAGIERYLASGLVKGIGPTLASRIVAAFGLKTLQILDETPGQLTRVPGLGKARAKKLAQAWSEQRDARQAMIFLQGHGISPAFASRILKRYGNGAAELVRKNPYRLALDVWGIGFRTADRIAQSLGFAVDSPERAEAGTLHALEELTSQGHVLYPRGKLCEEAGTGLEIPSEALDDALSRLARDDRIVLDEDPELGSVVYPTELFHAETESAKRLLQIARAPVSGPHIDEQLAFATVEESGLVRLAPQQREALRVALASKVSIVTGGPGVGKTTLVRGLLHLLEQRGRSALLAAPTGRAAKRLSEATGRPAQTLHRLLEFSPQQAVFQRNADRHLEADLIVVDETSMVDIVLFQHLLEAVPDGSQLLFVGDADQLPSVGPGAVLRDLLASQALPSVVLTEVFRQAAQSQIVQNAHRIHDGLMPEWDESIEDGDFFFIDREDPEAAAAAVCELVSQRIPQKFGLDAVRDIQVLTPMHRGSVGSTALNEALQATLNPDGVRLDRRERSFRAGDKVMQLRNDYDREIFNGDIGRIADVHPDAGTLTVDFDGRAVAYQPDELDQLTLAYACSVHKAQGSEYPAVVLPLLTQHYPMLQRNLLYTAVTRAKRLLVIVGSRRALALAVKSRRIRERYTRLAQRLQS